MSVDVRKSDRCCVLVLHLYIMNILNDKESLFLSQSKDNKSKYHD